MTLFPLWNPFQVLIVAIVLKYHLILIHTLLLAWMIVFIMANAVTLHAKIVLKRKRYSSSVLHVIPSIIIDLLMIQLTESQRELFAQCMLHAANSKHPQLSIFEHTRVPTSEDDFQNFIYLDQTLLYLISLIPFLRQLQMGHILLLV